MLWAGFAAVPVLSDAWRLCAYIVMPDSFRHPPGGCGQAAGWIPEQVRDDGVGMWARSFRS